ncbi:hypothetical protein [Acinetobacter baumannii]|uniref:hypothetical protein n=1 Tax=Acinetobacter baumannii TaxID=470 RepID=UPI002948EE55|nr:hypothetical protein [Acinetobacter baumannii]MDV5702075.1 hypothetical protein [Acinetobacter baumannii]
MTTFKEAQNDLVVVESVEGEYLTADEYYQERLNKLKEEEMRQREEIEKIKIKHRIETEAICFLTAAAIGGFGW